MTDLHQRETAADIVAVLRTVGGVAEAALEPDGRAHGAGSLRLQLRPGADEHTVTTQVDGLLRQHFGLAVETTQPPGSNRDVDHARPGRLIMQRVQLSSTGLHVTASITLGLDGREFVGESGGLSTATSVQRIVAAATLHAVEAAVGGRLRFEVEHVDLAPTPGRGRAALVVITLVTARGSERLSGASVVRDDVQQAVIRATLAAVNRRVASVLEGS